jgi:hypothetical protein
MPKQKRSPGKNGKTGFILGRAGFAKISAIEGIQLTPAMKARAAEAASKGPPTEEHRAMIVRAHRKA